MDTRGANTCIMTQVRKQRRITPKQAAARCGPLDELLDPVLFKALCDPTRAKIVACLVMCARPCAVGEIAECCDVDLSVVSRHLRTLDGSGVLKSEKSGRIVSYEVRYAHLCGVLRSLADAIETHSPTTPLGACREGCCGQPGRTKSKGGSK